MALFMGSTSQFSGFFPALQEGQQSVPMESFEEPKPHSAWQLGLGGLSCLVLPEKKVAECAHHHIALVP